MKVKKKVDFLGEVVENFLDKTNLYGIERTAYLKGFEHGVIGALSLEKDRKSVDLSGIKNLKEFEKDLKMKNRKELFSFIEGDDSDSNNKRRRNR